MQIFIFKYALTDGIKAAEAVEYRTPEGRVYYDAKGYCNLLRPGSEACLTLAEARKGAEQLRVKKLAALQKQMSRIAALSFDAA